MEIIKNVQDGLVGKYDLLNQKRVVMSVGVKDYGERALKLEWSDDGNKDESVINFL